MRILVFRGGAIGDFILTLPTFRAVRHAWPKADLTLVGYPHIAALAQVAGLINRVFSVDTARFSAYFVPERPLPPQESDFLRSFDLVISFLHDPDGALRSNWIRAGARRVISISPLVPSGHAADHFLRGLDPLGLKCADSYTAGEFSGRPRQSVALHLIDPAFAVTMARHAPRVEGRVPPNAGQALFSCPWQIRQGGTTRFAWSRPSSGLDILYSSGASLPVRLDLPADLQAGAKARLKSMGLKNRVIAIHPGSGSPRKNWPLSSFVALVEQIRKTRLGCPLWIAGEADTAIVGSLEAGLAGAVPVLSGRSLLETAAILSQCRGYVGNDSGITHLAAAMGIPTLALFGPTDPAIWGPRGCRVFILRSQPPTSEGLVRLPVDAVYRKLLAMV